MNTFQVAFYVLALMALAGAAGLAWARSVVHGALFLILALLAVAGLFLVLLADFLALVQVLLYGGAVAILILFAMMLTRAREEPAALDNAQKPWAMLVCLLVFLGTVAVAYATPWPRSGSFSHVGFEAIGVSLFTQWAIPFEIASLVLLVAMVGAIIIARAEEQE
ncbi:MAG: NADH-quinone oxidoreductase subunit J [Chloroflexi bacterium]|nr:NADH-quinone oxidoreductase subunit J [Chloroflexota bacterium]